ncbi:selenium metabolism-associated LysR family transcriptional regulator [Radiobacillus sp. PE A8.2]|uniref:selenium metabolism-associated LysR family transcriptional regulator n=1 Tax=Radiobacillus sp. PE A8.2 TaxID=3380349 RepID=UPI00388F5EE8
MNVEKLKTFITVADKKSFSEAAKILFLSQPTITAHIKALEQHLNTSLLERTTKQVQLTKAGTILYGYGKDIIRLSEIAEKEIRGMAGHVYGELLLACSLTIGENILPQLLGRFKEAFPLIQTTVDISNTTHILSRIKDHSLDLGLIEANITDPDIVLEPFLRDELMLVAKPGYFSHDKNYLSLDEVIQLPLILREKGSGTRAEMMQHLRKAGVNIDKLHIAFELGSTEAVKSAVEAGLGISIISKNAIKKELKLDLLQTYPIENLVLSRYFYIVYHRETVLKSTMDAFIDSIKSNTSLSLDKQ